MVLPYRTILRLPTAQDSIRLLEQEVETWLSEKLATEHRRRLRSGALFEPGIHQLGDHQTLAVARADRPEDGSRRLLVKWTEVNATGRWEVVMAAVDRASGAKGFDTLLVEATQPEAVGAPRDVDPPRVVRQLLEREAVYDGRARVTAEPLLIRAEEVGEVLDAITDPERSVSVIVAVSLGQRFDDSLRKRVRQLTAKLIGTAAVVVLTQDAAVALNEMLPDSHQVGAGHVRTYLPGVSLEDSWDGRRHRILGPATFARSIKRGGVTPGLQAAFAVETRGRLLQLPLPGDVRRSMSILNEELARIGREQRIELRTSAALEVPVVRAERPATVVERLRLLLTRWLHRDASATVADVDDLDTFIATQVATAETMLEEASGLESLIAVERESKQALQSGMDDLELELAEAQSEATGLRRRVEFLQGRLVHAQLFDDAYSLPATDSVWAAPGSVIELATLLSAASAKRHCAFSRVEFTGDPGAVEEVDRRDMVGRYAAAFWEYVQVLHDFAEHRGNGYSGSVHMYLTDDRVLGKKCSPERHAPTESESVMSRDAWKRERMLPVPMSVDKSGRILMDAHFKPTHRDTFAPRLHYFDDTARSGKVYIGYIGRHLTNLHTSGS